MKISINNLLPRIYIFVSLILFAFVNFNGSTDFADYTVPYIEGKPIVLHTLFSIIIIMIYLISKAITNCFLKFDIVARCLLIKCILDFAQVLFNDQLVFWSYFWHFACTLVSFIVYLIFSNTNVYNNFHYYKVVLISFGLILCMQVFYTFVFCDVNYFDLTYKINMVIPYGGTNIIASILVPMFVFFILNSNLNKMFKIIIMIIFTSSIILTKSRGGMLLMVIAVLFIFYKKNGKRRNHYIKNLILTGIVITAIFLMLNTEEVIVLFKGFTYGSSGPITLNSLTSGRIKTVTSVLEGMKEHSILFGMGMQSLTGSELTGAHNIIVDILARCGILGALNYMIMFFSMIKIGYRHNKCLFNPFFAPVVIIFINSLFEVCYFSYECDAMLWTFVGLMMGYYYSDVNVNKYCNKKSGGSI